MKNRLTQTLVLCGAVALLGSIAAGALAGTNPNKLIAPKMRGTNETPKGDPNGSGTAKVTLKRAKKKVCFAIAFEKIDDPLSGHIHKGGKGVAGPIKVTFFEGQTGKTSPVTGCAKNVRKRLIKKIRNNPGNYYVNLHNAAYPSGAIRDQLEQR